MLVDCAVLLSTTLSCVGEVGGHKTEGRRKKNRKPWAATSFQFPDPVCPFSVGIEDPFFGGEETVPVANKKHVYTHVPHRDESLIQISLVASMAR